MPYELKPRDIERRFFTCEFESQLIQRQQRKGFLHRIVTGNEKWIFYENLKKKKYNTKPSQSLPSTSTSIPRPNIHGSKIMLWIWWDQKSLVYYELLKRGDPLWVIGYNWFDLVVHCEKNGRSTSKNMIKLFFFMTTFGLAVAKVVKKYLETLKWNVLPHLLYSPNIAPSNYWLFQGMQQVTGSLLSQKSKIGSKIGSPPKTSHFFEMEFENCLREEKSSRQRWTIF